jgi:uncharacterized protein
VRVEIARSISSIDPASWNALAGSSPFLRHEFLCALHESGCASPSTGWAPHYLLLEERGALKAAMPLYLKNHSYGEYVFDWSWADAFHRHGLDYYPKLLCAVPFTPVTGPRLLVSDPRHRVTLVRAALELARELGVSSLHCLFPENEDAKACAAAGMLMRHGVQFHWTNAGYASFEAFLASFNHAKRKKIKQERRRVRDAGIGFEWREGAEITERDWAFFYRCYAGTYRDHHSSPYLSPDFFQRIGRSMPGNLMLVIALRDGKPIAASFNVHDDVRLYGRYWGTLEHHPLLHFETCYYQVIEYCIARGLQAFEGGAQGEHKMARGLLPVETCSAHWIAQSEFAEAIGRFLGRETRGIEHYVDELRERTPFRRGEPAEEAQPVDG